MFPGLVLIVCALLPLHPMMHGHVEFHASSHSAIESGDDHGALHDHPVVGAPSARVMPQDLVVGLCNDGPGPSAAHASRGNRNVCAFGGILSDHDVGRYIIFSTFLI